MQMLAGTWPASVHDVCRAQRPVAGHSESVSECKLMSMQDLSSISSSRPTAFQDAIAIAVTTLFLPAADVMQ